MTVFLVAFYLPHLVFSVLVDARSGKQIHFLLLFFLYTVCLAYHGLFVDYKTHVRPQGSIIRHEAQYPVE